MRLTATAAVMACSAALAAQKGTASSAVDVEYSAIVHQYRAGEFGAAAQALIRHDRRWTEDALRVVQDSWRDRPIVDIEAAAMVHTEIAVGESSGPSDKEFHLRAAQRLVELDRAHRVPPQFQRDWYVLAARHLQSRAQVGDLSELVDAMMSRFSTDAAVLLASGSAYELFAWSREPSNLPKGQQEYLRQAESAFRKAIAVAPDNDNARLRLGRVLSLLQRPAEALETLQPLHERQETDARFAYLVALFQGAADELDGRVDAAVASYREATMRFPDCQTPWIALSAALRASGDLATASDIVRRAAETEFTCDDPWWRYKLGEPSVFDAQLAQMRREVVP